MGTVFKRGGRWGINYRDPDGQQIRKVVAAYKPAAERILRKIETSIDEGRYLDIKENPKISFKDFVHDYLEAYVKVKNRSVRDQKYQADKICKVFGNRYLHQITSVDVRRYMADRLKSVKPSTVNRDLSMLKCMLNRAIEWGYLDSNPLKFISKLKENNERCRWLTEIEQKHLLSFCHGLTRSFVLIALRTGMRYGEISHLKWQQAPNSNYVDLKEDVIFIHESLSKSQKSRWIPLSQTAKWELLDIPRQENSDYIFLNSMTGKPIGSIKNSFNNAVRKSGLKDFKFHDLRHTFASQLVRSGVDLYVVQRLLGHASIVMTQRYAHLKQDMLTDAIKKIDVQLDEVVYNGAFEKSTI